MGQAPVPEPGTAELVAGLVASELGLAARSVEQMAFGHGSVTFRVETATRVVYARTNVDADVYAGTKGNLQRLRELGLPVPEVLAEDLSLVSLPFAYQITDAFDGRDLRFELGGMTRGQQARLAAQIVAFERAVGGLDRGQGYGFAPIGRRAPHHRWVDAVRADRGQVDPGADREVAALLDEATRRLADAEDDLDDVPPTCFLDDLTIKNVIVSGGELVGVVDFDVVAYGDPLYWLALTEVAVVSDVGPAGSLYVDELIRLWDPSDDGRRRLALYSALHAVAFLSWDADDLPRRRRLMDSTRAWLNDCAL